MNGLDTLIKYSSLQFKFNQQLIQVENLRVFRSIFYNQASLLSLILYIFLHLFAFYFQQKYLHPHKSLAVSFELSSWLNFDWWDKKVQTDANRVERAMIEHSFTMKARGKTWTKKGEMNNF